MNLRCVLVYVCDFLCLCVYVSVELYVCLYNMGRNKPSKKGDQPTRSAGSAKSPSRATLASDMLLSDRVKLTPIMGFVHNLGKDAKSFNNNLYTELNHKLMEFKSITERDLYYSSLQSTLNPSAIAAAIHVPTTCRLLPPVEI